MVPMRSSAELLVIFVIWFVILCLAGAIFIGGLLVVFRTVARASHNTIHRPIFVAAALAILTSAAALLVFQTVAATFRYNDMGSQRDDYATYALWAERSFFAVCVLVVVLGGVIGFVVGQRAAGRGVVVGLTSAGMTLLYVLFTLPITDFLNAYLIGQSFVIDDRRC